MTMPSVRALRAQTHAVRELHAALVALGDSGLLASSASTLEARIAELQAQLTAVQRVRTIPRLRALLGGRREKVS